MLREPAQNLTCTCGCTWLVRRLASSVRPVAVLGKVQCGGDSLTQSTRMQAAPWQDYDYDRALDAAVEGVHEAQRQHLAAQDQHRMLRLIVSGAPDVARVWRSLSTAYSQHARVRVMAVAQG